MEDKKNKPPRAKRGRKPKVASQTVKKGEEHSEELEEDIGQERPTHQKVSNLEESVDYLKKIGLKKVSNKTFINEEDLGSFLEGDFTNINRTKALGFIKILEREYPVNLQELRQAYISYYQQNRQKRKEKLIVEAQGEKEDAWKKHLLWLIPSLLLIAGILFFIFSDNDSLSELETDEQVVLRDSNSQVIQEAAKNLAKLEKNDSLEKSIVAKEKSSLSQNRAVNETDDDLDLDAMVKQMVKEYNLSVEASLSAIEDEANLSQEETSKEKNDTNVTIQKEVPAKIVQKSLQKKSDSTKSKENLKSKKISSVEKSKTKNKLYIKPIKKCWIGIIYLDNFTKQDFLIKSSFKFDTTRPQLIVVGHKFFEIFNNGYSYRFRGQGPIRFIYKNGNIMQINKKEFLVYSKGVNW